MRMAVAIPEIGSIHRGRVVKYFPHGALLELECGYKGLLRNSDVSWLRSYVAVESEWRPGDEIEVVVLETEPSKTTDTVFIRLGRRQLLANPWHAVGETHAIGDRVAAVVVELLQYGAVVELPSGFRALVHKSELSWTEPKPKPEEHLRVGEEIAVTILSIQADKMRIQASYREALDNPWEQFADCFPVGSVVRGRVVTLREYGAFVMLANGCTGLLHTSAYLPEGVVALGESVSVKIIGFDQQKRQIAFEQCAV